MSVIKHQILWEKPVSISNSDAMKTLTKCSPMQWVNFVINVQMSKNDSVESVILLEGEEVK
ncbi:hypothetical protein [Riemerella columbina]|uniref:hypothetical protein n=1 Tax=Riemerella columbina TaxID=103810 RepID=UPI00039DDBB4|nr:hypothetical protein [Riemerella columbina]